MKILEFAEEWCFVTGMCAALFVRCIFGMNNIAIVSYEVCTYQAGVMTTPCILCICVHLFPSLPLSKWERISSFEKSIGFRLRVWLSRYYRDVVQIVTQEGANCLEKHVLLPLARSSFDGSFTNIRHTRLYHHSSHNKYNKCVALRASKDPVLNC